MARIVIHTAKRPYRYTTQSGENVWICMCGLSETYPICSGKHRICAAEKEDEIIAYDQDANKIEIKLPTEILQKLRRV
ncbi:MAG: hypothetical protein QW413_03120 [Nitrososphaerota archaeon]